MTRNGSTYSYHRDALGSITHVTGEDGAVVQRYEYDSYGNLVSVLDPGFLQPYAFTGREWEPEVGLYYFRARYYDPAIGRFINKDPIGFGGGVNLYEYVGNQPTNLNDPLGLYPGQLPPPPPGYNASTWSTTGITETGRYVVTDPQGNRWIAHPEDDGHWRHWDKESGGTKERVPPNSKKPWPNQKRKPYGDQCADDPNGSAPEWTPPTSQPYSPFGQIFGLPIPFGLLSFLTEALAVGPTLVPVTP
jgi:RHS repeat-associated protein